MIGLISTSGKQASAVLHAFKPQSGTIFSTPPQPCQSLMAGHTNSAGQSEEWALSGGLAGEMDVDLP
jgi:hypothetical protein